MVNNQIQIGDPNDCPYVTTTAITTDYVLQEYGWICPKCGRVYSPSTTMCLHCGDNSNVIVSDKTFPDDWLIYHLNKNKEFYVDYTQLPYYYNNEV